MIKKELKSEEMERDTLKSRKESLTTETQVQPLTQFFPFTFLTCVCNIRFQRCCPVSEGLWPFKKALFEYFSLRLLRNTINCKLVGFVIEPAENQAMDLELSARTNRVAILNTELTTLKAEMKEKDEESGRLDEESKTFHDERVEAVSETQKMLEELAGGNAEIPQLEITLNSKSQLPDQIQAAEKDLSDVSRSIDEEQKILDGSLKDAPVKKMIANELKEKLVNTSQVYQRR